MDNTLLLTYHLDQLRTPEMSRVTLVCGAIISMIYKNNHNVIPGGVIIPGFIVITFLMSPLWGMTLVCLTVIIYFFYKRFFMRVFTRKKTPIYILGFLSVACGSLLIFLYVHWGLLSAGVDSMIGAFIPAVIVGTCLRQKPLLVMRGMLITTIYTILAVLIIYSIFGIIFKAEISMLMPVMSGKERIDLRYPFLQFAMALLIGYSLYYWKDIRCGGYLVAPYVASLILTPLSTLMFFIGFILVKSLTAWICRETLTVGLDRYAIALCLSTLYVWIVELIFIAFDSSILPFRGSSLFVIIALLSYVNDSILYKQKNIFLYITVAVIVSLLFSVLLEGLYWITL